MNKKIKIDIVSDVVCPWCIIGYKALDQAITELNMRSEVEIEWQPFELNPGMPKEGEEINIYSERKYGTSLEQRIQSRADMTSRAKALDFEFNLFEGMKVVNTMDAHILLDYAKEMGKQTELKLQLFEAYFTNRQDISEKGVLLSIAEQVGLNKEESNKRLSDAGIRSKVKEQISLWTGRGISSVPSIIFNERDLLPGSRSVESYKEILKQLRMNQQN